MDKLIDPLYDKAEEEKNGKIVATRFLLTRQYGPGDMKNDVLRILQTLPTEDLKIRVVDHSRADDLHLDEMTFFVFHKDSSPFEDLEELTLMWNEWTDAFEAFRPIIAPVTVKEWKAVAERLSRMSKEKKPSAGVIEDGG